MLCYGLQGCSSEHSEVRSVLQVLSPHIAKCTETLNAQEIGNALYGLKGCSSEHSEVRSILRVLASHIAKCTETLSAQEIGIALIWPPGLQQ